ncbi:hypothetical protein [Deinococcus multiflagellatus]|uniref:Uncharacterized protein n=1 Tax=Deinococcus multiflagellatus TaxID=1656887 RepID=A0ABW1ZR55_9DEIO|nr:hypothetical protein [Deinococcus multiflagellatus]MBZ9715251.1 hypothetical protein [Deinococcus multiflagellatus]
MTAVPRSFDRLLWVLHLGSSLSLWLLGLGAVALTLMLVASGGRPPWLVLGLILLGMVVNLSAFGHLRVALATARGSGHLHGEVSERLRAAGQRFLYAAPLWGLALALLPSASAVGSTPPARVLWAALLAPDQLLMGLTSLALPLLLLVLAGWLDEGRALVDQSQGVV